MSRWVNMILLEKGIEEEQKEDPKLAELVKNPKQPFALLNGRLETLREHFHDSSRACKLFSYPSLEASTTNVSDVKTNPCCFLAIVMEHDRL